MIRLTTHSMVPQVLADCIACRNKRSSFCELITFPLLNLSDSTLQGYCNIFELPQVHHYRHDSQLVIYSSTLSPNDHLYIIEQVFNAL